MSESIPRYLYRYRPMSDEAQIKRELNAISKSYLWFSKFEHLNDPAELADAEVEAYPKQAGDMLGKILGSEHGKQFVEVMNNRANYLSSSWLNKGKSGICCFSEREDNQAMWAYYASNYSGICIKYDMKKLLSLNEFCWGSKVFKVQYQNTRKVLAENMMDFGEETSDGLVSVLTKHPDWEHESEWRLFKREESGEVYHTSNAIIGITLGARIENKLSNRIRELGHSSGIDVSHAKFEEHIMTITHEREHKSIVKNPNCVVSESALDGRKKIVTEGYDLESLDEAIKSAQHYSNAKTVFMVNLGEDKEHLYIYIMCVLSNASEKMKSIKFKVKGKKFSNRYSYS